MSPEMCRSSRRVCGTGHPKRAGYDAEEYHPKYHPFSRSFGINFFILMEPPAGLEPATC